MTARLALPRPMTHDHSPLRFDRADRPAALADDAPARATAVVHSYATDAAEAALFLEALGLVDYAPGQRTAEGRSKPRRSA